MEFPAPKNTSVKKTRKSLSETTEIKIGLLPSCESNPSSDNAELLVEELKSLSGEENNNGMNNAEPDTIQSPNNLPFSRPPDSVDSRSTSPSMQEEIDMLYDNVPEIANHFNIIKMIGEGTFSSVFLANLRNHPEVEEQFALKHIIPTSHPSRIENELYCLLNIGGQDNVIGVKLCFRNKDHVIIVMPYFPHKKFQDYLYEMSVDEARDYMKNLLIALRRVHEFDVIHRDIKPSNFLYDPETRQYALVDFGLATGPKLTDPNKASLDQKSNLTTSLSNTKSAISSPAKTGGAVVNRSRSREPLSPLKKKEDGGENKYTFTKTPSAKNLTKKATPPLSANKMFAPRISNMLAMQRQSPYSCSCFGKPMICEICVARSNQNAPRAGTAGFRSPEVLLKSPQQDTAVDVWAAGVIFLSILSARYPFFKALDDLGFLAQIISLLGTEPCVKAAKSFGKMLTLSENIPTLDLETACKKLRSIQMSSKSQSNPPCTASQDSWSNLSSHAYNLLGALLDPNPKTRITAKEALNHPFFTSIPENQVTPSSGS